MASNNTFGVSTVIRDDFFNDPFFKDWWADFEAPKSISVGRSQLERHSEDGPRRSLLDSFLSLRDGSSGHRFHSSSSQAACMQLKNGRFSIEVDIQDFDPEDIEIKVEGESIILEGRREIKRGSSSSIRQFNQKFALPAGIDISKLATEVTSAGSLVIFAPQLKGSAVELGLEIAEKGDVDIKSSSEARKTTSEAAFEVEGGSGTTKRVDDTKKKNQQSVTKRETEDGWEEEIVEQFEEVTSSSTSTTMMTTSSGGEMKIPMVVMGGAAGGSQTTEVSSAEQNIKAKDGKIIEMQKNASQKSETKEMVIPIQIQGRTAIEQKPRTPKPRLLPFEFPTMPSLGMDCTIANTSMPAFNMSMPSASDMMAEMQAQVEQQMAQMQMGTRQSIGQMQIGALQGMDQKQSGSVEMQASQSTQATQNIQAQHAFTQSQQQAVESAGDVEDQDFFVPLKHIAKVKKNALSEATAMAKMRDGIFELVVNIHGFEPEDVHIVTKEQAVYVSAKHVTVEGFVTSVYEHKFNLPEDVDTEKLTSGMSRDGILMIRVPKRASPERIIPIQREVQINAVKKALAQCVQSSVDMTEMSADQLHSELEEKNIVPMNVEKPEDAVKAASAEMVEAMTIGIAEACGADAGEAAGTKSGAINAEMSVASVVAQAVLEAATQVGFEIAGEAGVKAALAAATVVGQEAGAKAAREMGAEIGATVGRIAGQQAASVAGAEELSKLNMAEITEEKANELKPVFEALGVKIGADAGDKAGTNAGDNIDPSGPINEAVAVAKAAAEKAALQVKAFNDLTTEDAEGIGATAGEEAGKAAGAAAGENVAVEQAIKLAKESAVKAAVAILGQNGVKIGETTGAKVAEEVARKLGKEMGGNAGLAAGRIAGGRAAIIAAKQEVGKVDALNTDVAGIEAIKAKVKEVSVTAGKEAGASAGQEAGSNVDIEMIVAEAVASATKAVEEQALEMKAFETMSGDIAKEAGKLAGKTSGKEAGAAAGEKVALEAVMIQAIEAAEKAGQAIFGEEGAACGKAAGEAAAKEIASRLGKELGEAAGLLAGEQAGEEAGLVAGKSEASKHNILEMKAEELETLKASLSVIGTSSGKEAGTKAGAEAGSKIDIPYLLKEALEAAVKAAEQAATMAKAAGQEEEAKQLEAMVIQCAKEAGEKMGEETAVEIAMSSIEEMIMVEVEKAAKEAGGVRGKEVFGEFGEQIGMEAGVTAGRKAAMDIAQKLVTETASAEGKSIGLVAGEKAGTEEATKQDLKGMTKDQVAALRAHFTSVGAKAGKEACLSISKSVFQKINMETIIVEVKKAATAAGEKYAIKAREFQRLATKIAEEAGCKSGEKTGEQEGGEAGEEAGEIAGEKAGRIAGQKAGEEIAGEEGGKVGAEAGARAGRKFGFKVGRDAGMKAGMEVGRLEGMKAGGAAGAAEALKHFKIGISKDRVLALKKIFAEVGASAGIIAAKESSRLQGAKRGEEEGSKFGLEHGRKAGAAAARKLKDAEAKALKEEGGLIGEQAGGEAGEKAGIEEGEKAGGDEAERLGGDEGERIGREIAGEEGAKLGREIGAEAARLAGAKLGKKIGKTVGAKAGRDAGKKACFEHAAACVKEISREKVTAMRKLFAEIATGAGAKAGLAAARAEVMRAVHEVAIRAAAKAAREALLAMASRGKVKLSADWKPTSLIAVINARSDLSDMEKIKLAAKAKMEGNLSDLLPKRFKADGSLRDRDDQLAGKLKFTDSTNAEATENLDAGRKWKTVVFSDLPADPQKADVDMSKEKVSSLKKRFETKNMKDNEAYVIM